MANVQPETQKKMMRREYRVRLVTTSLIFVSVALVVAIVFLIPSLVLSQSRKNTTVQQLETFKGFAELQETNESFEELRIANEKITLLSLGGGGVSVEDILDTIAYVKPTAISVSGISMSQRVVEDVLEQSVTLSGVADTRTDLLSFVELLEKEELFSNVDLPISNLAKEREISFSLSFLITSVLGSASVTCW